MEANKARDPQSSGAGPSVAERLKSGWSAANATAYQYVQVLDVMVGQASEYVGLAYGAVKILLIAQISHEEVKKKVKEYLEHIQLKFSIIDHLTAYMPSTQLVALVAQAYSLFNRFIAKALKHYTRSRPSEYISADTSEQSLYMATRTHSNQLLPSVKYMVALTMPWKRFQDIVDSIESKIESIKEVAQYVGLAKGHSTMVASQQTLALLRQSMQNDLETKKKIEGMRIQLEAISIKFPKVEGVRKTADSLARLVEERLCEPTMETDASRMTPADETESSENIFENSQDRAWKLTIRIQLPNHQR